MIYRFCHYNLRNVHLVFVNQDRTHNLITIVVTKYLCFINEIQPFLSVSYTWRSLAIANIYIISNVLILNFELINEVDEIAAIALQ